MKKLLKTICAAFIGQPMPGGLMTSSFPGVGSAAFCRIIERLGLAGKSKSLF